MKIKAVTSKQALCVREISPHVEIVPSEFQLSTDPTSPTAPLEAEFESLAFENLMKVRDPPSRKVHIPINFASSFRTVMDTQTPAHPAEVQTKPCAT